MRIARKRPKIVHISGRNVRGMALYTIYIYIYNIMHLIMLKGVEQGTQHLTQLAHTILSTNVSSTNHDGVTRLRQRR